MSPTLQSYMMFTHKTVMQLAKLISNQVKSKTN